MALSNLAKEEAEHEETVHCYGSGGRRWMGEQANQVSTYKVEDGKSTSNILRNRKFMGISSICLINVTARSSL